MVRPIRAGREIRYQVVGAELSEVGRRLGAIGAAWETRLTAIKAIAEEL